MSCVLIRKVSNGYLFGVEGEKFEDLTAVLTIGELMCEIQDHFEPKPTVEHPQTPSEGEDTEATVCEHPDSDEHYVQLASAHFGVSADKVREVISNTSAEQE